MQRFYSAPATWLLSLLCWALLLPAKGQTVPICTTQPSDFSSAPGSFNYDTRDGTVSFVLQHTNGTVLFPTVGEFLHIRIYNDSTNALVRLVETFNNPEVLPSSISIPSSGSDNGLVLAPGNYSVRADAVCSGSPLWQRILINFTVAVPCSASVTFSSATNSILPGTPMPGGAVDTIRIAANTAVSCTANVFAQGGIPSTNWTWTGGLLDNSSGSTTSKSGTSISFSNVPAGTYNVTTTTSVGNCLTDRFLIIIAQAQPCSLQATITNPNPLNVVTGQPFRVNYTITSPAGQPAVFVEPLSGGVYGYNQSRDTSVIYATGTYQIVLTVTDGVCSRSDTLDVIVGPGQIVLPCFATQGTFATPFIQYNSANNSLNFELDYAPNAGLFVREDEGALIQIFNSSNNPVQDLYVFNLFDELLTLPGFANIQLQPLAPGQYTIRFQGSCDFGNSNSNFLTLGGFTVPGGGGGPGGPCASAGFYDVSAETISIGGSVTISPILNTTTTSPFVNTKRWNFGPGATPATATGEGPFTVTYNTSGRKRILITVDTVGGCQADTSVYFVEVINCSVLVNTISAPTTPVNAGDNFTVENTSFNSPDGATFNWNFAGANVVSGSGKGPYTLNFSNPGTYVISVSYGGFGCSTATVSRTITVNAACAQVSGVTVGTTTATTAQVSWTQGGANAGFNITYRPVGVTAWQSLQTAANVTSRTLSGLQANTNYEVVVRRICQVGVQSTLSPLNGVAPVAFSTNNAADACAAPANFQQASATLNSATVTWSPVAGATSYVVHIRRSGTTAWTGIFNKAASATSHTFTGLMAGTSYDYFIYAGCVGGLRSANSTATGSTGSTKTDIGSTLTLYPNPAVGGVVNLRAEGMTSPELNVQVLDLTGRVLYNNTFRNDLGNSISEQLTLNLSPGTYLLRTTGGLSATQRLVVVE